MANDGGVSFFVWGFMLGDAEFDSSIGGSRHDFVDERSIHSAKILIYIIPYALGAGRGYYIHTVGPGPRCSTKIPEITHPSMMVCATHAHQSN